MLAKEPPLVGNCHAEAIRADGAARGPPGNRCAGRVGGPFQPARAGEPVEALDRDLLEVGFLGQRRHDHLVHARPGRLARLRRPTTAPGHRHRSDRAPRRRPSGTSAALGADCGGRHQRAERCVPAPDPKRRRRARRVRCAGAAATRTGRRPRSAPRRIDVEAFEQRVVDRRRVADDRDDLALVEQRAASRPADHRSDRASSSCIAACAAAAGSAAARMREHTHHSAPCAG